MARLCKATSIRHVAQFSDPTCKRVLRVGGGWGREAAGPCFEMLGEEGRARIKAVTMEVNAGYAEELRAQCRQAKVG